MLSDIGIGLITIASTVIVCVVPVLYCIQRCSKRVIIMPAQTQHLTTTIKSAHTEDDNDVEANNTS